MFDAEGRGCDESLSTLTTAETRGIKQLKKLEEENEKAHREFRKLTAPGRDDDERDFVVSFPPNYMARLPFGRGTRPMLAFDMKDKKVVFLKDYWRAEGVDNEGEIYRRLEESQVKNIPSFGWGNDVGEHKTLTDTLKKSKWAQCSKEMVSFTHYRMTLDVVGRPLTSFRSSREFVSAIADAIEGKTSFVDFIHATNCA